MAEPSLPPEIQRVADGATVRYVLPVRQLGPARLLGFLPLAFGLAFGGFALFWMLTAAGINGLIGAFHPARLLFAAFGLPFLWGGFTIVRYGLLILLPSQARITVTRRHIVARDSAGIVWWTRRVRRDRVESLYVSGASDVASLTGTRPSPLASFARGYTGMLLIMRTGGKRVPAVVAYPQPWLPPLATALSGDLEIIDPAATLQVNPTPTRRAPPVIEDHDPRDAETTEVPPQPADSKIQMVQTADTLTVVIPPAGIRGSLRGVMAFAIVWLAFCTFMTGMAIVSLIRPDLVKAEAGSNLWFGLLFMIPFWAVGVGVLLGAIHASRRRAVLLVTPESVVFTQTGPLGRKEKQWPRAQVLTVATGPSNVEVNDQSVPQLQLTFRTLQPYGLLNGRSQPELDWLAALLRHTCNVLATPEDDHAAMGTEQPANSRAELRRDGSRLMLTLPRPGFKSPALRLGLIIGTIFMLVPGGIAVAILSTGQGHVLAPALFCSLFATVGLLILGTALNAAFRRVVMVVDGQSLNVQQKALFTARDEQWALTDIQTVQVGPSTTSINNRPLPELKIVSASGKERGLLMGRDPGELYWVAGVLREALAARGPTAGIAGSRTLL